MPTIEEVQKLFGVVDAITTPILAFFLVWAFIKEWIVPGSSHVRQLKDKAEEVGILRNEKNQLQSALNAAASEIQAQMRSQQDTAALLQTLTQARRRR